MEAQEVEFEAPAIEAHERTLTTARRDLAPVLEAPQALPAAMTPMAMISHAIQSGAGMDVVERLMTLQERWEANQARKAFDEAMAAARAEIKPIMKKRTVDYPSKDDKKPKTSYKHEDLAGIAEEIDPVFAKHGLSYRWAVSSKINAPIEVTCIITHRLGHREETTLTAGADSSGSKNSIQAIGSTVTYLQRYTLKAAAGLAAAADNDGKTADESSNGPALITAEQVAQLEALAKEGGIDIPKFCEFGRVNSLADIHANKFNDAVAALKAKAKARAAVGAQ